MLWSPHLLFCALHRASGTPSEGVYVGLFGREALQKSRVRAWASRGGAAMTQAYAWDPDHIQTQSLMRHPSGRKGISWPSSDVPAMSV